MGAWGAGSFENDAAMDFAGEIESLNDLKAVLVAANDQGHVLIDDEIDADLSSKIIVAGECLAAMRGHPSEALPHELAQKLQDLGKPKLDFVELVRSNVSAVMSRSELLELWAEADEEDRAAFNVAMTDLVDRLCKPAKRARKPKAKKAKEKHFNHSPCSFCDQPMGEVEGSMFDITVSVDDISSMRLGGWAHITCLNAALHPKHLIQNWELDEELLDYVLKRSEAERDAREAED